MAKPKGFRIPLREPDASKPDGYVERLWRIARERLPQNQHEKNWGYCCRKSRTIVIHSGLEGDEFWGTLWHEVLHATMPDLDEAPILRAEYNLRAASMRAGLFTEDA